MRRLLVAFLLCGAFMPMAPAAVAASASAEDILKALAQAKRDGLCTDTASRTSSDCLKTTTRCNVAGNSWADYIEERYENAGGTVVAKSGFEGPYDVLDYLRADWGRNSITAPGPVQTGSCYCACGANDTLDACRGKEAGFPVRMEEDLTFEECTATCSPRTVAVSKCAIAPVVPASASSPQTAARAFAADAFCFTPGECAAQGGFFEQHADCRDKGKCYAAEPAVKLQVPIGEVTEVQGISRYIVIVYRYALSITALVATVMFIYGAFLFLVGSAVTSISSGKRIMTDAVIGMILVFSATMILRTINPATTKLDPIRVYLINTRQFLSAALCSDLNVQTRLARAGIKPALISYENVSSRENAFDTLASSAECGVTYWIDGTDGGSCEGMRCFEPAERCVACTDPDMPGCGGKATDQRVCVRTIFGGTIDYVDSKYPIAVELLAFCNFAQSQNSEDVIEHFDTVERVAPARIGRQAGTVTTNEDQAGRAAYLFDLEDDDVADAETFCNEGHGGLRGFALAVSYKEPYSSSGLTLDDTAVLSRSNCRAARFDGYADGSRGGNIGDPIGVGAAIGVTLPRREDVASAIACGVRQNKFLNSPGTFWTTQELRDALAGRSPITCDFTLSKNSAPNDPASDMCR